MDFLNRLNRFLIGNTAPSDSYWQVRLWLMRGLGFIYLVAGAIVFFQGVGLWGKKGLLPIGTYVDAVQKHFGGGWGAVINLPSLFYLSSSDGFLLGLSLIGIALSVLLLIGRANVIFLLVLWLIQLSLVNSGQLFYSYGWETELLEFTFLCIFLVRRPPARVVVWSLRWMLFRLMFGAGMIKMRGDPCWMDLTCLIYHYETQPIPSPLSFFYHHMPPIFHYGGALFNHFAELIVPFGFFGPIRVRRMAGVVAVVFQIILILSGNLAWLNWITLVLCFACFDDEFLAKLGSRSRFQVFPQQVEIWRTVILSGFASIVLVLSVQPALNLLSPTQAMNTSYDRFHLINSYGAFGSVSKERYEIIISGTDEKVLSENTQWSEFQFPCAPGDIARRPCLITPYHYHLDWQMWFSAMRPQLQEQWLYRLAVRLLENEPSITQLFASVPFPNGGMQAIKMDLYRYRFASWKDWPHFWWQREFVRSYMAPISKP